MIDNQIIKSRSVIQEPGQEFDQKLFKLISHLESIKASKISIFQINYLKLIVTSMTAIFAIVLVVAGILLLQEPPVTVNASDNLVLTKLVYNEVVKENEELIPVEIDTRQTHLSNDFYYSDLKVVASYYFQAIFEFQLRPYFIENHVGEVVEIVIARLELKGKGAYVEGNWYTQEMIIIKYRDEIVGFLSGSMGKIPSEPYLPAQGYYTFQSFNFLTEYSVVKYYEDGDDIYYFDIDMHDIENVNVNIRHEIVASSIEPIDYQITVIENTYKELSSDIVIDLIRTVIIERVLVTVQIIEINLELGIIYVSSESVHSLESIQFRFNVLIVDLEENKISLEELTVGDLISIYYYDRYNGYLPKNIFVEKVTLVSE